jgi:RHS repeat-associated protein
MTIVMVIHYGLKGRNGLVKGRKRKEKETRLIALLNYRKLTVEDFALNGYACEDYTETDTPDYPQDTLGIASGSLALIRDSMNNKTPQTIQIPNQLHRIELCDGREDHLLNEEISQLQGDYVITQTIDIPDTLQMYATATTSGVSQQPLEAVLAIRSSGQALYLEGFDPPNIPGDPGTDVWNGGDPFGSVLSELREAIQPEVSYYIQDHLGNTRVMYHTDLLSCQDYDVLYRLEHVLDYYPYGKTLREYVPGPRERFQSTEHERDMETGLDHRGARMYDGDVGRFLGVDPLASSFPAWSLFSYVFNNPLSFTDPDGRAPETVKPTSDQAYQVILRSVPKEAAKVITRNSDGTINANSVATAIDKTGSTSENLRDLYVAASSETVFTVGVSESFGYIDESGSNQTFSFSAIQRDPPMPNMYINSKGEVITEPATGPGDVSAGQILGATLVPKDRNKFDPVGFYSTSQEVQVHINGRPGAEGKPGLSIYELAKSLAHELYGHGVFFDQGKDFGHRGGGNKELEDRIFRAESEVEYE